MKSNILYKVYCGKNGKFYTYKDKLRAENLFTLLSNQNFHTYILKIADGSSTIIAEYR